MSKVPVQIGEHVSKCKALERIFHAYVKLLLIFSALETSFTQYNEEGVEKEGHFIRPVSQINNTKTYSIVITRYQIRIPAELLS